MVLITVRRKVVIFIPAPFRNLITWAPAYLCLHRRHFRTVRLRRLVLLVAVLVLCILMGVLVGDREDRTNSILGTRLVTPIAQRRDQVMLHLSSALLYVV